MTLALADYLALGLLSIFGGWLGAFLNGYLGRKGENLATHEDIAKLVDQQKATTDATERIRAEISGTLWEKQERWRLRKELYVRLIKALQDGTRWHNNRWEYIHQSNTAPIRTAAEYERLALEIEGKMEAAREEVRQCFALATVIDPAAADIVDAMWTEADQVPSGHFDMLSARAAVYNSATDKIIQRARDLFSG